MKKKLGIVLIIIATIGCIFLGFHTRKQNAISVMKIQTNSEQDSYLLKTKNDNIIIIDGGNYEDSSHLEKILLAKGGVVDGWFITSSQEQNFGALQKIMENGNIQIGAIYTNFDSSEENAEVTDFLATAEKSGKEILVVPEGFEVSIDNFHISTLNVAVQGLSKMIINIDNTYKNIIIGNTENEGVQEWKESLNAEEINLSSYEVMTQIW